MSKHTQLLFCLLLAFLFINCGEKSSTPTASKKNNPGPVLPPSSPEEDENVSATIKSFTATPDTLSSAAQHLGDADPSSVYNTIPDLALPLFNQIFIEPTFGTQIKRIADNTQGMRRHIYSQLQAFNSDESMILFVEDQGFSVYRTSDFQLVSTIPAINSPRWNPLNPRMGMQDILDGSRPF